MADGPEFVPDRFDEHIDTVERGKPTTEALSELASSIETLPKAELTRLREAIERGREQAGADKEKLDELELPLRRELDAERGPAEKFVGGTGEFLDETKKSAMAIYDHEKELAKRNPMSSAKKWVGAAMILVSARLMKATKLPKNEADRKWYHNGFIRAALGLGLISSIATTVNGWGESLRNAERRGAEAVDAKKNPSRVDKLNKLASASGFKGFEFAGTGDQDISGVDMAELNGPVLLDDGTEKKELRVSRVNPERALLHVGSHKLEMFTGGQYIKTVAREGNALRFTGSSPENTFFIPADQAPGFLANVETQNDILEAGEDTFKVEAIPVIRNKGADKTKFPKDDDKLEEVIAIDFERKK